MIISERGGACLGSGFSVVGLTSRRELDVHGALGTNRTCDPLLRRKVLYPLSYEGNAVEFYPNALARPPSKATARTTYNALNFNR